MLQHTYLSWARSGFGRHASNDTRELNLNVTLPNAGTGQIKIPPMKLYGPGDCIGFDPSIIVRTDPPSNVSNFEANFFPFIEFRRPDFPWLLTPQQPDNNNNRRLPPWLCLIVVNVNEAKPEISSNPSAQTILRVAPKYLPDLADAWAWAHCQISYDGDGADADLIKNKLQNDPAACLSRLLCPRQLEDNQRYYACVVPTYEAGRRAGLTGLPDVDPSKPNPLQLAWDIASASASITLPVYFYWEFATGSAGDFESLVRSLQPYTVEPEKKIGQRTILVQTAAAADPSEIVLEGILRAPRQSISNPSLSNDEIGSNLKSNGIPLPIYGSVYNKGKSWDDLGEGDGWLNTLNRNPGYRIAAGLGAQIVRKNQETYMATAWDRLGDARGANQQIAQAQLSGLANERTFERLSDIPLDNLRAILFQAELHRSAQPSTNATNVALAFGTSIPSLYASTFRRFVGANSPTVRRLNTRLQNSETLNLGDFKSNAEQNVKIYNIGNNEWKPLLNPIDRAERKDFLSIERLLSEDLRSVVPNNVQNSLNNLSRELQPQTSTVTLRRIEASTQPIDEQRQNLLAKYDPQKTLFDVVQKKIEDSSQNLSSAGAINNVQPLTALESAIRFPDALFEALKELPHDYILPGIEHLPNNSVTILEANAEFIAAFMIGVNHEFHRELQWRNFPIAQAYTYFRSFWLNENKDIRPPSTGSTLGEIYQNRVGAILALRGSLLKNYQETLLYLVQAGGSAEKPLFPTGQDRQILSPLFHLQLGQDILLVAFGSSVNELQGVTYTQGDSSQCIYNTPGYFVVFQQPAIEFHFGLDIPTENAATTNECGSGNNFSWKDVQLLGNRYINIGGWNEVRRSADVASKTRQLPVQLAIHARELLPACVA